MQQSVPEVWEKILWKGQVFPDNYVPADVFLVSLQRNPYLQPYSYWSLVVLACAITQHLSTIFIFLAIFVRLNQHLLDPRTLIWISVSCFVVGHTTWNILEHGELVSTRDSNHLKTVKSSIMIFLSLMTLSPVLRTLTAATSPDSIWALAAVLFIINALLADYRAASISGEIRGRLTSVLSMNAAISASVVLASRLSTDISVFALILFAVQSFALFPMLKRRLQSFSRNLWVLLTMFLWFLAIYLFKPLSPVVMAICFAILSFVTFAAPMLLIWAQKYKNHIRGPWDAAIPKVR